MFLSRPEGKGLNPKPESEILKPYPLQNGEFSEDFHWFYDGYDEHVSTDDDRNLEFSSLKFQLKKTSFDADDKITPNRQRDLMSKLKVFAGFRILSCFWSSKPPKEADWAK